MDTLSYKVIPACVPSGLEKYEGRFVYISGYGSIYTGGNSNRYLLQAYLPVLTDARCRSKFPTYNIDSYTQVCAGEQFGNKDFCDVHIKK
jgi:trypsin